jgi:hypothetical protein
VHPRRYPLFFPWTVRIGCSFPVTLLCTLLSKSIKLTQLFSLQRHCESVDQCQGSSASRNSPRALLFPVSLAMILSYALRSNWELRHAAELFRFFVRLLSMFKSCHHTECITCKLRSTLQGGCIFCHFLTGCKLVFFFSYQLKYYYTNPNSAECSTAG